MQATVASIILSKTYNMKKQTKKRLAKFFLIVFSINFIITPKTEAVAMPVVIALPTAQVLLAAGGAMVGIIGALFVAKHNKIPNIPATILNPLEREALVCKESTSQVIPSVTCDIIKEIVENKQISNIGPRASESVSADASSGALNKTASAEKSDEATLNIDEKQYSELPHQRINHIPLTTAKAYLEILTRSSSKKISNKMLNNLVEESCKNNQQAIISYAQGENAFRATSIPYGIQVEAPGAACKFTAQLSGQSAINTRRMAATRTCWDLHKLQAQIRNDKSTRAKVLQDVRGAIKCLTQTQSLPQTQACDLTEQIEACLIMDQLYIESYVVKELSLAIENLQKIYFHQDGSLCWKAFGKNTNAPSIITKCIDNMHRQLGKSVVRTELIPSTVYNELKMLAMHNPCKKTGIRCSSHHSYVPNGRQFNQDILNIIESCKHYDFEKAYAIQQQYPNCSQLQNIIDYYKVKYKNAINTRNAIFDNNGIVHIAKNDPAYLANKHTLNHASVAEKEIVNQNLLVRHHIKETMHKRWNIPQTCPQGVNDALYQIIGNDSSALSDVSLLQKRIEHIIENTPKADRNVLARAFYEPNGVLKEYALLLPTTKSARISKQILTPIYATEREKLNTLICLQVKKPEYSRQVQESIHNLEHWLNASNTKEQIDAKTAFNNTYEAIIKQEQKVKVSLQPQDQKIVDANSSAPMPPEPEFEPDNEDGMALTISKQKLKYDNKVTDNDLHHVFGRAKHNLDKFLELFDGNKVNAFQEIYDAAFKHIKHKGINGLFNKETIEVSGMKLCINGRVLANGTVKIGTAFIP